MAAITGFCHLVTGFDNRALVQRMRALHDQAYTSRQATYDLRPLRHNWLARPENQRITLHFTPTGCSWINLVECFFSVITRQAIRRGSFNPTPTPRSLAAKLSEPSPNMTTEEPSPSSFTDVGTQPRDPRPSITRSVSMTVQIDGVPSFHVVFFTTRFRSLAEAQQQAPEHMAKHVQNSKHLHEQGRVLMAGAFLDQPGEPLCTMAVLTSHDEAQHYVECDPFVQAGLVEEWHIREWGNMFR